MPSSAPPASSARLHLVAPPRPGFDADAFARAAVALPGLQQGRLVVHRPDKRRPMEAVAYEACREARLDGGVVLACGGDGTINAVAQAAWPLGVAMGALPNGTFNYFCRNLSLEDDPLVALRRVVDAWDAGAVKPCPVGQVNGRLFLVNCSIGLYPKLLEERERDKRRYGRHRWVAMFSAARALLTPSPGREWTVLARQAGGDVRSAEAVRLATLFVGANALQLRQLGLHGSEAPTASLTALMMRPQSRATLTRVAWRALRARLDEDPHVESFSFDELEVYDAAPRPRTRVKVACDGESRWMQLPLRMSWTLRPLWLVVPPDTHMPAAQTPVQPLLRNAA